MKKSTKTWLITGCSSGLGRAFAQEVLKNGYNAVITSRNPEDIQNIIKRKFLYFIIFYQNIFYYRKKYIKIVN